MRYTIQSFLLFFMSLTLLILCITKQILQLVSVNLLPFIYFTIIILFIIGIYLFFLEEQNVSTCYCHDSPLLRSCGSVMLIFFTLSTLLFYNKLSVESFASSRGIQYTVSASPTTDTSFYELYGIEKPAELEQSQFVPVGNTYHLTSENYMSGFYFIQSNLSEATGKNIVLNGFISRESTFDSSTITLTRIAMYCCIADSMPYGILATLDNPISYENGQWVTIRGKIDTTKKEHQTLPLIRITTIEPIEAPKVPHVLIR